MQAVLDSTAPDSRYEKARLVRYKPPQAGRVVSGVERDAHLTDPVLEPA